MSGSDHLLSGNESENPTKASSDILSSGNMPGSGYFELYNRVEGTTEALNTTQQSPFPEGQSLQCNLLVLNFNRIILRLSNCSED